MSQLAEVLIIKAGRPYPAHSFNFNYRSRCLAKWVFIVCKQRSPSNPPKVFLTSARKVSPLAYINGGRRGGNCEPGERGEEGRRWRKRRGPQDGIPARLLDQELEDEAGEVE